MPNKEHIMEGEIETSNLVQAVTAAKSIGQEGILRLGHDKIELSVDDPANVANVQISIDRNAFLNYNFDNRKIGIDVDDLSSALRHIDDEDPTSLTYKPDSKMLVIEGSGQKFNLKPIASQHVEYKLPDLNLDYSAEVILPGSEFTQAISAADEFSDYLIFYIQEDEGSLKLRGEGDLHETERTIGPNVLEDIQIGPAYNVYSLEYLSGLAGAIDDETSVELKLAEKERPMEISFAIADGDGSVEYMIAPHIVSE